MALAAAAAKGLTLSSLRRARALWAEEVQTVTLKELWGGKDAGQSDKVLFAQRTHRQLKVRIAHRLRDFLFLPYKALSEPAVRCLYDKYVATYNMHEDFRELRTTEDVAEYWAGLAETFVDHQNVISLLGIGRQRIIRLDAGLAEVYDNFLRRFFVSRIGTHLLGSAFFHQVPAPPGLKKPAGSEAA
ncbi:PDK [Symbiodinium sp. CCMP2592]|nr:PDK [Symbiodinium sp. CCMP2592]